MRNLSGKSNLILSIEIIAGHHARVTIGPTQHERGSHDVLVAILVRQDVGIALGIVIIDEDQRGSVSHVTPIGPKIPKVFEIFLATNGGRNVVSVFEHGDTTDWQIFAGFDDFGGVVLDRQFLDDEWTLI